MPGKVQFCKHVRWVGPAGSKVPTTLRLVNHTQACNVGVILYQVWDLLRTNNVGLFGRGSRRTLFSRLAEEPHPTVPMQIISVADLSGRGGKDSETEFSKPRR